MEVETEEGYQIWLKLRELRKLKKLPLVEGVEDPRLRRIYPLMQKSVQKVLEFLSEKPVFLIVFGSALTMKCNITSDLNLCIQTLAYDKKLFYELEEKIAYMAEAKGEKTR